jgi:GNAT superfamily N-acetyltransferase
VTADGPRAWVIRDATARDVSALAQLWHDAWHDAHGGLVPPALLPRRGPDYFHDAIAQGWQAARLAQAGGMILGFNLVRAPVLDLLFLRRADRGTGLGADLLRDAERVLQGRGCERATLDCLAANTRACAFYERHGWQAVGPKIDLVSSPDGDTEMVSTIYEKRLARSQ